MQENGCMADVARHLEVERKFILADRDVPDPASWPGVTTVSEPVRHELDALYYDTGDVRLAGAGVTMRRRTGGADDGWHLKVPGEGEGRLEHGLPLGEVADGPPQEFVAQVAHLTGGEPLRPICRVRTTRLERLVDGPEGPVASVCDDRVTTDNLLDPRLDQSWHELEVELTEVGTLDFLEGVTQHLAGLGIQQVSIASKLRAALTPPDSAD